jgi:hypothetical protein
MEVQIWTIEKLIFYLRNPRKNDAAVDRMVASLELDPRCVDVAVPRGQSLRGQEAVRERDGRRFDQIAGARREEVWNAAAGS